MLRTRLPLVFFLSSIVMLTGCANKLSPIAITLTDLGTASKTEHSMTGLRVMRTVNITGLGPNEVVGSMSVDTDPPNNFVDMPSLFSSKDYPDSLGFRLSPDCSRIVETTFGNSVKIENVITLRDGVQELVELVSRKLTLEIKQTILSKSAEVLADETLADKPSKRDEILKTLQRQYPADNLTDAAEVNASLTTVTGQLKALQQNIDKKNEALKVALQTPGIVVTRWSQERKESGMFDAFKAAMFQGSKSSQQEGFLVLGQPRVTTLVLGNDLIAEISQTPEKCKDCLEMKTLFSAKRTYVTYYQLSAKHIAWGETRSGISNLAIKADIGKIVSTLQPYVKTGNFSSNLKDLQANAELEMSRAYNYGNNGVLSEGTTRSFPMRFGDTNHYLNALIAEQNRAQGYRSIYNARGTLEGLITTKLDNIALTEKKLRWEGLLTVKLDDIDLTEKLKLANKCAPDPGQPIKFEENELLEPGTQSNPSTTR